ncbi:hypothetical protein QLX08_005516 [Tetragonisca angustula]|uniref:Uncharacterized protein n=1 Tax=Tetragonisca angustula TaxID=166442 RepID=A0AAW0ZY55_9HYME
MENIEKIIDLLYKRKAIRNEQFVSEEKKQITEYNNLMCILQTIKDERNNCKDNIIKNLQCLTKHKHSVNQLVHNSENIPRLPISQDYHRQATMFLSESIDFINKLPNIYTNFDDATKENNINSANLLHNITSCTNSVESKLCNIKSLIANVNTLQKNADILQEYCLVNSDENVEI